MERASMERAIEMAELFRCVLQTILGKPSRRLLSFFLASVLTTSEGLPLSFGALRAHDSWYFSMLSLSTLCNNSLRLIAFQLAGLPMDGANMGSAMAWCHNYPEFYSRN